MKHLKMKLVTGLGVAAGYVLGTRAGRGQYEKIKHTTTDLWNDPRVQDKVHTAEEVVKDKAHDAGETLKDKAHDAGETLKEKVHGAEDVAEGKTESVGETLNATKDRADSENADLQDQVKEAAEQIQSEDKRGRH